MALPHYLTRSASGRFVFRMRIPADLRGTCGRDFIKHGLGADLLAARLAALRLSSRYAAAFDTIRGRGMAKDEVGELLERLKDGKFMELTLERTHRADGSIVERWQMDNDDDVRLYQQATAKRHTIIAADALPAPIPAPPRVAEVIALGMARTAWLKSIEATTLPKTLTIKRAAVSALVRYLGHFKTLDTITRADLARLYQHLRDGGASTPTLTNKQSYLSGFFAWAQASGHYPTGDNPAAGHIRYGAKEKRQRRKLGFKAFTLEQVQTLFHPDAFAHLSPGTRWAALLGLYAGARASEVGQLLLSDVETVDGVPSLLITDEGEHQKLKTEASKRLVPLHPDLLGLGFLDHVEGLRARGDVRLFPQALATAKNGAGNWISKAFGYYLRKRSGDWKRAKRGFHSLRKTVIQELQGAGVPSEMRAQLVGHELDDEHHATYSRPFTIAEKLNGAGTSPGLVVLAYGLDLDALRPLLTASVSRRRAKTPGRKPSAAAATRKRSPTSGGK